MQNRTVKKLKVLITGSGGLVGSQAVRFFHSKGFEVSGIDNDMRRYFFGKSASTSGNIKKLKTDVLEYKHYPVDIRNFKKIHAIFKKNAFDLIIHTAGQPSHDWAINEPMTDFSINSTATLYLLENFRRYCPLGVFVFLSTNKVYGDTPNRLSFKETKTRFEVKEDDKFSEGVDETMPIDQSLHSLFGASKTCADLFVQEYGRYFNLKTVCFRAGCISGAAHSGCKLHGFLSHLGKSIAAGKTYEIFGYKGKQVRDNIHAFDLVSAIYQYFLSPKCGEVYNIGGGQNSNISVLEAIAKFESVFKKKARLRYIPEPRRGDHKWYISNLAKFRNDFPCWKPVFGIDDIINDIAEACKN